MENTLSTFGNEGLSNYEGIISTSSYKKLNNKNNISSNKSTKETFDETQDDNSKILFVFEWKDKGNNVEMTGDFVNWNQYFKMNKDENNIFKCEIYIPKKEIQFKFIVDNKWVFSNDYEIKNDGNNNINNYIDLTNIKYEKKKKKDKNNCNKIKIKENWCNNITIEQMKSDAPNIPFYYEYPFRININTNQIIIGRSKFLSFNYNSINDENNSYKKILYPEHINIFHILFPCIGNKNYSKVGLYYRFKQKAITFIYYKPF
jgi:hypothetical protein